MQTELFGVRLDTVDRIRQILQRHPEVDQAILFGSRAKGTHRRGSDIDLALVGLGVDEKLVNRLYAELDELPIPYQFSLVRADADLDAEVAAHIERVGVVFYQRMSILNSPA